MTAAADIAALVDWLDKSSQPYTAPLGGLVYRGSFAQVFRRSLDDASPADMATHVTRECLPLFSPVGTAIRFDYPKDQPPVASRALHAIWKAQQASIEPGLGFPPGIAIVGLTTAAQTLREAAVAAGIDPLADRGIIWLPVWAFPAADQARLLACLPVP